MTKKKAIKTSIPMEQYNALVLCHKELKGIYAIFGTEQNAYDKSLALRKAQPFADYFIEDATYVEEEHKQTVKPKQSVNKKESKGSLINKAIEALFKANKDNKNGTFARFSYLKIREIRERVIDAIEEAGEPQALTVTMDDNFIESCGGSLLNTDEVFMFLEEDMNIQMPEEFTGIICKIEGLKIEEFVSILYKAGQRNY